MVPSMWPGNNLAEGSGNAIARQLDGEIDPSRREGRIRQPATDAARAGSLKLVPAQIRRSIEDGGPAPGLDTVARTRHAARRQNRPLSIQSALFSSMAMQWSSPARAR